MIARIEDDYINLYSPQQVLIGKLKWQSPKQTAQYELHCRDKRYVLVRRGLRFYFQNEGEQTRCIKKHWWFNQFSVLPSQYTVYIGLKNKWRTRLSDRYNRRLLRIRDRKFDTSRPEFFIKLDNEKLSEMDILIALFGHVYHKSTQLKKSS